MPQVNNTSGAKSMPNFNDFKNKTLQQIRWWAWAAAVLPIAALAGVFFTWRFADGTFFGYIMVTGETIMFSIAVVWWWWAMYILRNLVKHWDDTRENVIIVRKDLKSIKEIIESIMRPKDK